MKRVLTGIFVLALFVCFASVGFAQQKNTGCGLGSMIFEGQDGLMSQTFAVTTNGTFGNQTFGITSGTSNCDRAAKLTSNEKLNIFVAQNMDGIAKDIARGEGEHLDTMAGLMQVPDAKRTQFYTLLQKNFSAIYSSSAATHIDVLSSINALASSI